MAKYVTPEMERINACLDKRKNKSNSKYKEGFKRFVRNKPAVVGLVIIVAVLLMAIFANFIAPYAFEAQDYTAMSQAPSLQHLFGTDQYGRDILSRCIYGARYSLVIALICLLTGMLTGGVPGIIAGYVGGKTETVIMRIMDVLQAMPSTLLAIAIVAVLGNGIPQLIIAMTVSSIPSGVRVWRSAVLQVKSNDYVEASKAAGAGNKHIILQHMIPNCVSISVISMVGMVSHSIMMISSLCYIGLGIAPPTPEWGVILAGAKSLFMTFPYMVIFPVIVISVTSMSFQLVGNGLRDALDPRLK